MKTMQASTTPSPGPKAKTKKPKPLQRNALERIWEAAIAEFSAHGLKGSSTSSIAKRAGLTQPQLYYYIASKEELYEDLLRTVLEEWAVLFVFDESLHDPAAVLSRYIRKKLEYAFEKPELSRIYTREMLSGSDLLDKHWPKASQSAGTKVKLMEGWMDQGLIRRMDARLLLMNIWAVTQHYADADIQVRAMFKGLGGPSYDQEHIINEVTRLFLGACGLIATP
ncbi:TetR family transcriptional regulator C-terminal domain-containing protein [Paraburkholderia sp. MM5482-R1]|uniref:TetR family transcriptional regulator C-terminal domain-containing protein n=1 Tax=unclassified Paraburkholderia TaxID=2615204 RepID=UPI003D1DC7EB